MLREEQRHMHHSVLSTATTTLHFLYLHTIKLRDDWLTNQLKICLLFVLRQYKLARSRRAYQLWFSFRVNKTLTKEFRKWGLKMNVYLMRFSRMAHPFLHIEDTVDLVLCTGSCNFFNTTFAKEIDCELTYIKLDSSEISAFVKVDHNTWKYKGAFIL